MLYPSSQCTQVPSWVSKGCLAPWKSCIMGGCQPMPGALKWYLKLEPLSTGCERPAKWGKLWKCKNLKDPYINKPMYSHPLAAPQNLWMDILRLKWHIQSYYPFYCSTASATFLFRTSFSPFHLNVSSHCSNPVFLFLWPLWTNPSDAHNVVLDFWTYYYKCIWTLWFAWFYIFTMPEWHIAHYVQQQALICVCFFFFFFSSASLEQKNRFAGLSDNNEERHSWGSG